jgi:hypothetical protein
MGFDLAPEFRVTTERSHLIRARGHITAETLAEFAVDAILAKLAEALRPGSKMTKARIAEAVEAGAAIALQLAGVRLCAECAHPWSEHVAMRGCFDCGCTGRRPHATEAVPVPIVGGF